MLLSHRDMQEIYNIQQTNFRRVGGRNFGDAWSSERNNEALNRVWDVLADLSQGTLAPEFERLYWFGGMFSPAYDIQGNLGKVPPSATIQTVDKDLELLLPAYKSVSHRGATKPALLGVWASENQGEVAQVFMNNLDFFCTRLTSGAVYAIMRRPDGSALATQYDNPRKFREDYFNVIQGEQGQALIVTNDPKYALKCYQREQVNSQLDNISDGKTNVPFVVSRLPQFVNRLWVAGQVAKTYPRIEATIR